MVEHRGNSATIRSEASSGAKREVSSKTFPLFMGEKNGTKFDDLSGLRQKRA
jgi:hypothetical protein